MRWFGSIVVAVLVLVTTFAVSSPPAYACSCASPDEQSMLKWASETSEIGLFTGEQTGGQFTGDNELELTFRVDRVFAGDIDGPELTVDALDNNGCGGGGSQHDVGIAGFALDRGSDNGWVLGDCTFPLNSAILDALVDGLPPPPSSRPAEFVIGHSFASSNLALLDAAGEITAFGEGEGQVQAIDVCPDTEHIATASVDWPPDYEGDSNSFEFEVRTLADLSVVSAASTTITREHISWPTTEIRSLECHLGVADLTTLLAARIVHDDDRGQNEAGQSQLVVIEGSAVSSFEVGAVRSLTVDPLDRVAYAITPDGKFVSVLDLDTGTEIERYPLPATQRGRHIQPITDGFLILGLEVAPDAGPDFFPRVDSVLTGPLDDLSVMPLGTAGALIDTTIIDDGVVALLRNANQVVTMRAGESPEISGLGTGALDAFVAGSEISIGVGRDGRAIAQVLSLAGPLQPLDTVGFGNRVIAIEPTASINLPADAPATESAAVSAARPLPQEDSRLPYLLGGAVTILALVGAVAVVKRRTANP